MLNKKGYVLVYALGVIAVIVLLIISLTNITLQRTHWINRNVYDIEKINKTTNSVEAAATELREYFEIYINEDNRYLYELDYEFQIVFTDIESRYNVEIRDLTKESCEYPNNPDKPICNPVKMDSYTYAYEIVSSIDDITAQKKFFLSMIPSFLYFALGSQSDITINGGAYIDGDIYVNNKLYLADSLNYILNGNLLNEYSSFVSVEDNNNLYLQNDTIYSCKNNDIMPCYSNDNTNELFIRNEDSFNKISSELEYSSTFLNTPPTVKKYTNRFLDVNFDSSYVYYINDAIKQKRIIDLNNIDTELTSFINEGLLHEVSSISQINEQPDLSIIFKTNKTDINESITFDKNRWIIINGDLEISNYGFNYITIDANILVTGNITIAGNVSFNSTIYSLGEGLIHNASIKGINDNQLVLLTKDDLQFTKINQFDNTFISRFIYDPYTGLTTINPDIKGFFYTETNAQIYTASSYIAIEGGLFTNDFNNNDPNSPTDFIENSNSIGLMINSFRGTVYDNHTSFIFHSSNNHTQSRLIIKHNIDIIKNQPKGLPLNKQINFLFEDTIVK